MPLKLELKSGDKFIINGAVIENAGPNTKLLVHNKSAILRQKEIISAEDSVTPASRVYFALQCAYIFPDKSAQYLEMFEKYAADFERASPSSSRILGKITSEVRGDRLYQALKAAQGLLKHEKDLLDLVRRDAEAVVHGSEDTE